MNRDNQPGPTLSGSTLHVGQPNLGDTATFQSLVGEVFHARWFTNHGPLAQRLETQLAAYLQVKHCILVCNGTVGLQIACHALELTGEVILPAFTFVATAHALQWERVQPVFADVDPLTHNICPASIEQQITDRTSAILGVHLWGQPCDVEAIDRIARSRGLVSLYDAAHAFGCQHQGRMIGNFGNCEVFSFHATKFFHTFEGGAITTNDDQLADKIRLMRNFGFEKMDSVVHLGTNGKMSEVHAAMGLVNLDSLDVFITHNRRNFALYSEGLTDIRGIKLLANSNHDPTNHQYVVLEVDAESYGSTRDELMWHLHSHGIRARRYFYPGCHRMEPYATLYPDQIGTLQETDRVCQRVLCLPTGTAVSAADVERVCQAIRTLQ